MRPSEHLDQPVIRPLDLRLPRWSLHRSQFRWVLVIGDILLVNLAALIALWLGVQRSRWWLAVSSWDNFLVWFISLSFIWFALAEINDLYNLRVAGIPKHAVAATFRVAIGTMVLYLVMYFLATPQSLPRLLILFFSVTAALLLAIWRWLFALLLGSAPFRRRILVVGVRESDRALLQAIRENAPSYFEIIGLSNVTPETGSLGSHSAMLDGQTVALSENLDDVESVNRTGIRSGTKSDDGNAHSPRLAQIVAGKQIDELILASTEDLDGQVLSELIECREQGIQISNLTAIYEELTGRLPLEHVGKIWTLVLPLEQDSTHGLGGVAKRVLDVVIAGVGIVVTAPLWLLIALIIRLDSNGPVLLRQARVGRNGHSLTLLKFRSMVAQAEEPGHPVWAAERDPRVTRVGRILRPLKLDELPQFVNVLRGEMSVVGPRPERPEIVKELQAQIPFYRIRHVVRPGLTGWAAIHFRYGRSVGDALVKLQYDLYYIKHQSLYLDLLIIAKTLGSILFSPKE